MDPNPMPWRTIDAAVTITPAVDVVPTSTSRTRITRGTLVVIVATGLVSVAAFVLAFGSGTSGALDVVGAAAFVSPTPTDGGSADPLASSGVRGSSIVVEIVGAVVKPGVYALPVGSRVGTLVDAAGGYGPRVDTARASHDLHLASVLRDGDQIRVPARDDPASSAGAGSTSGSIPSAPTGPLDLNEATSDQLDALPGIGPVTAAKIVASREQTRFTAVGDLQTRKLVGQKTFDGLKDLVAVH